MEFMEFLQSESTVKLVQSAILLVALLLLRAFVARIIVRNVARADLRRKWVVSVRSATVVLLVLALTAIWAEAVRTLAVSMAAIAVAFVLTTRDMLQSMLASLMKPVTAQFRIGDRIEVGGHRGDVIDQDLFSTTILEVGPGRSFHMRTGRKITFPNAKLLDSFVVNESYTGHYVVHVFSVPLKIEEGWQRAEKLLLEASQAECGPFLEEARVNMRCVEEQYGLEGLPVQPRISLQMVEPGKLNLLVRIPSPVGRQGRIEQAILRRFLEEFPKNGEVGESEKGKEGESGGENNEHGTFQT